MATVHPFGAAMPCGAKRSHAEAFGAAEEHASKWHVTDRTLMARSAVACQASWDKTKEKLFQGSKQYFAQRTSTNQVSTNRAFDEVTPMSCQEEAPAQSQRNITTYFNVLPSSRPEPMSVSYPAGPVPAANKSVRQYTLSSSARLAHCFSVQQTSQAPAPTPPCCQAAGRVGLQVACSSCHTARCHDCVRLCHVCAATLCGDCQRASYEGDETKTLCFVCR